MALFKEKISFGSGLANILKEMLIATLYHMGKISANEAAKILGKTRREFEELLPKFGFSILNDSPENIEIELNA